MNRPKTGYDLVDGELVPNDDAVLVQDIFRLRADGASYPEIEARTGVKYSTVRVILQSRIYLGEVLLSGRWYPGRHQAVVSPEEFDAAQRVHVPGRRPGRDPLSGRIICGLCDRKMSIGTNGEGRIFYRCRHRGQGCAQPARTNLGLHRAALLGMRLIGVDGELQEAIRKELRTVGVLDAPRGRKGPSLEELAGRRRKLLELYYSDKISAEGFADEEQRIAEQIERVRSATSRDVGRGAEMDEIARRFEEIASVLRDLDTERISHASNGAGAADPG